MIENSPIGEDVGNVYVDSGKIIIIDPENVKHLTDDFDDDIHTIIHSLKINKNIGMIFSPGYGDGCYPVTIDKNRDVTVTCIDEEIDESEEDGEMYKYKEYNSSEVLITLDKTYNLECPSKKILITDPCYITDPMSTKMAELVFEIDVSFNKCLIEVFILSEKDYGESICKVVIREDK